MKVSSRATHPLTRKLLFDADFCRSTERLLDAAVEIVAHLPRTTADIELLLNRAPHRLSHEVQYIVLNTLDSLPLRPVDVKRLLPTVLRLLRNLNSPTAYLWMKLGCLLGDGFLKSEDATTRKQIVSELLDALRTARSVHAREGAFHGIEHALNTASMSKGKKMLGVMHDVALSDRALSIRRKAFGLLRDGYWWGNGGHPKLHTYARKQGRTLRIGDYY